MNIFKNYRRINTIENKILSSTDRDEDIFELLTMFVVVKCVWWLPTEAKVL